MANRAGELIATYNALFYVSMGIAVVGLILAVTIFFLFDIPMVFAIRTGRMERRMVERMNKRSTKGGNFAGKREVKKKEEHTTSDIRRKVSSLRMESHTGDIAHPKSQSLAEPPQQAYAPPPEQETVPLAPPAEETMPLAPVYQPPAEETVPLAQPPVMEAGVTVELSAKSYVPPYQPPVQVVQPVSVEQYRFDVFEEILLCDTQERI